MNPSILTTLKYFLVQSLSLLDVAWKLQHHDWKIYAAKVMTMSLNGENQILRDDAQD